MLFRPREMTVIGTRASMHACTLVDRGMLEHANPYLTRILCATHLSSRAAAKNQYVLPAGSMYIYKPLAALINYIHTHCKLRGNNLA
jgi:hypothetical protein